MISALNRLFAASDRYALISDRGDCMYAGMDLTSDIFLAPGHYVSMGVAVPATVVAQLALPARGPVELVGNGAFQVTGLEIATAAKLGLNPIVVLFDNGSYSMLRFIDRQRNYYRLIPWDFAGLARAVRTEATTVNTQAGFALALARAGARAAVCHRRDDLSGRHLSDPPPAHRTRGAEGGGRGRLTLAERRR